MFIRLLLAAILAAGLTFDGSLSAHAVDFIHQIPGAFVRHIHRATGRGDRTAGFDRFKQLDFTRPNPAFRVEIDPDAKKWQ